MNYKFSCVLDYNPLMAAQAFIWLNSLKAQQIDGNDIYIHLIGKVPNEYLKMLKAENVNIIESQPFDSRNKYCNKLVQLDTFSNHDDYDYVFLMDCDTAIVSMEGLSLKNEIYAKEVDFPNPPIAILKKIFEANNLTIDKCKTTFKNQEEEYTDWNNCNGGLYIISSNFIKKLNPLWKHFAKWCIENKKLFTETYSKHADQVGFALAMNSLGEKVTHLGVEWNFPIHINKNLLPEVEPKIVHFHTRITHSLTLAKTGKSTVDKQIKAINLSTYHKRLELEKKNIQIKTIPTFKVNMKISHSRDIEVDKLESAFREVNRPDLLQYLVDVSRSNLGFYTSHYPRVFEYTWLFDQLEGKTGAVLDIGAGVCPLPIALALNGFTVTTVDSHSKIRKIENKAEWNEWGFLDYSLLNNDIQSHNIDFLKFKNRKLYDFIYSISVIEHIPKTNRLKVLKNASKLLKKGGKLLLTIDLYPNTENLWNLSEDKEVEPIEVHGTIDTFKNELKQYGFEIVHEDIQRDIPKSRTDVYYVIATLKRKPFSIFN